MAEWWRGRLVRWGLVGAGVTVLLLVGLSARAAVVEPGADVAASEMQSFTDFLTSIGDSPELSRPLPMAADSPKSILALSNQLAAIKAALAGKTSFADIAAALDGASGSGGVTLEVSGPAPGSADAVVTAASPTDANLQDFVFEVEVSRSSAPLPISLSNSLVNLTGGSLTASISVKTSVLQLQLDKARATSTDPNIRASALSLRMLPDAAAVAPTTPSAPSLTVEATANGTVSAFSSALGFAGVSATGNGTLNVKINVAVQNPGDADGRLSADEWSTIPLGSTATITFPAETDPAKPAIDVLFTLTPFPAIPKPGGGNVGAATVRFKDQAIDGTPPEITPNLAELDGFVNLSPENALAGLEALATTLLNIQNAGRLALSLPFVDKGIADAVAIHAKLAAAADALKKAANPATPEIKTLPTFTTIQDMKDKLAATLQAINITPQYDPATKRLTFSLALSDSGTASDVELNLGSLGIVSEVVTITPALSLSGSAALNLKAGFDLAPLPRESGAGPLSCQDGTDNDGDSTVDAADTDCATLKTMEQRAFFDVGTNPATAPNVTLGGSLVASVPTAAARIGLLTASISGASLGIGSGATEDGGAAGSCADGVDNGGGGGVDGADPDCEVFRLKVYEDAGINPAADGLVTLEELIQALGTTGSAIKVDTKVNAAVKGTIPVSASLGSFSVGPKNITLGGAFNGSLADAAALVNNLSIDASAITSSDLFSFSPCGNNTDDDGDGTVNDGCDGGPAADDKSEDLSTGLFDQLLAVLQLVADQVDAAQSKSGDDMALDQPIPLLGKSLKELLDLGDIVKRVNDALTSKGETACGEAVNAAADDDGDGFVNDGCPKAPSGDAGVPEAGAQCTNGTDDDGDSKVNDGCPASLASLQALAAQLKKLVENAFDSATQGAAGLSRTVAADVGYDPATKSLLLTLAPTFKVTRGTTFSLDLSDIPELAGTSLTSVVDGTASGQVKADLEATPTIGFGIELDTMRPFLLGSTGLHATATASATDLRFDASVGPIKVSVGKEGDLGTINLGVQGNVDETGGPTDHRYFSGPSSTVAFTAGFGGTEPAACDGVNGNAKNDACAVLPLYLNTTPIGTPPDNRVAASLKDITKPSTLDVTYPDFDDLTTALAGEVLNLALLNSGLQRLVDALDSLLGGELLGFKLPIIGDGLQGAANMLNGIGGDGNASLLGAVRSVITGGNPLDGAGIRAKDVRDTVNGLANNPSNGIGKKLVDAELLLTPTGDLLAGTAQKSTNPNDFKVSVQCGPNGDKPCDTGGEADTGGPDPNLSLGSNTDAAANCGGPSAPPQTSQDDDNGDGVIDGSDKVNDGCPSKPNPEFGSQCNNGLDEDGDGVADDGCPDNEVAANEDAEAGDAQCNNGKDADPDGDGDGIADDGCGVQNLPIAGPPQKEPAADCDDSVDSDHDGFVNDGCESVFAPASAVGQIRFDANLGQSKTIGGSTTFDLGIPGLGLKVENGGVFGTGAWQLKMGFGVNKKLGFFVATDNNPELQLGGSITMSDPSGPQAQLAATLGFLKVDVLDGDPANECVTGSVDPCRGNGDGTVDPRSSLTPKFTIDLTDPGPATDNRLTFDELSQGPSFGDLFTFAFTATADVNAHIQVSVPGAGAAFPRVMGDLHLDWSWNLTSKKDPDALACKAGCNDPASNNLRLSLDSMAIDAGSFLNNFIGPVVRDIQEYTKPLKPVIDTLNHAIPVLSDFAGEPVTLLKLAETFGGSQPEVKFLVYVAKFLTFIQNLPTINAGNPTIPMGSIADFVLDGANLQKGPLADTSARSAFKNPGDLSTLDGQSLLGGLDSKMAPGGGDVKTIKGLSPESGDGGIGITFPFLQQPSKLLGLLFKQDVVLIHWEVPNLKLGFSYSQKFGPIWAVPPVFVQINGSASITGHLGIGYDTEGLRKVLFDGASAGALLDGLFIDDKDFVTGVDVPEIAIQGRLAAGAEVSVLIFSAGAEGGINLTLSLDLQDPNNDGKLKFGEVSDIITASGNPFCIFSFSGKLSADISVYAEVNLFLWSARWSKTLADITIFEFNVNCEKKPAPVLASETSPGVLSLNIGPRTGHRDTPANPGRAQGAAGNSQLSTETNEKMTVRVLDASTLEVTGLQFTQQFKTAKSGGWTKVVADGGIGEDAVSMLEGANPPEQDTQCANATDDSKPPNGSINEGCAPAGTGVAARSETAAECANANDDDGDGRINDGCPVKVVAFPTGFTTDLKGGDGADKIVGAGEDDTIDGGGGNDSITTGQGANTASGGSEDDVIQGGTGVDHLNGDGGNDAINADLGADVIFGGDGNDTLNGGLTTTNTIAGSKVGVSIPGQADGGDEVHGGNGSDTIDGGGGGDSLYGDADPDNVQGSEGADTIEGGDEGTGACGTNGDTLLGGDGADTVRGGRGDDLVVGGSVIALTNDVGDTLLDGGQSCDTIVGDNATFANPPVRTSPTLVDPSLGGGDTIAGGDGDDRIFGQKGNDAVTGGGGADTIDGNADDDGIDGGPGHDVIHGHQGDDTLIGGDEADDVFGDDGLDVILGDQGTVAAGATAGTRDDDTITLGVGSGGDTLRGGSQRDIVHGQAGDDTIFGDGEDDLLLGGAGIDTARGGLGADEMFGNESGDTMFGDAGDDRMVGGSDDTTTADDADKKYGGSGNDAMLGDNGKLTSVLEGGETLKAESTIGGADLMLGEDGTDRMFGERAGDTIYGGPLDDYLEGNGGDDAMYGEAGQDDMIGGGHQAGVPDEGETVMSGGPDIDVLAGDNATISRTGGIDPADGSIRRSTTLHDLGSADAAVAGDDRMNGDEARDILFGGGENDLLHGDGNLAAGTGGDDHIEGNGGQDTAWGEQGQDDLVGGTTQGGGGHPDGTDQLFGGDGTPAGIATGDHDVIAGDNAAISRPTQVGGPEDGRWFVDDLSAARGAMDVVRRSVQLFDVATTGSAPAAGTGAGDRLFGGADADVLYGQAGGDELRGDGGDDHLEGNAADDTAWGGAGQDDLVGGTGRTTSDDPATAQDGRLDGADRLFGGDGNPTETVTGDDYDVTVGDNATVVRSATPGAPWVLVSPNGIDQTVRRDLHLYDVGLVGQPAGAGTAGGDILRGEANDDLMYGQGGGDDMQGGTGDDKMEGNDGQDTMLGQDGNDDMLGGTGLINGDTVPGTPGRLDAGEVTIEGGNGFDVMAGDNAIIRRVEVDGRWRPNSFNGGIQHERVYLIDINSPDAAVVSGGDVVKGDAEDDVLYGQGGGDTMLGGTGQDYMEGNAAADDMFGDAGQDDMVGGTGLVNDDPATGVDGRFDGGDTMRGESDTSDGVNVPEGGGDVMTGDNAVVVRPLTAGLWTYLRPDNKVKRDVTLVDVENVGTDPAATTAFRGDDKMWGNGDDDSMWGQGGQDEMHGGVGDDTMEGNHDVDRMWGDPDQDDMVGGGAVAGRLDQGDFLYGGTGADFQLGDNGTLARKLAGDPQDWVRYVEVGPGNTTVVRLTERFDVGGDPAAFGHDLVQGDQGDDHQWGQDGHDEMHGNDDNDDMYGELGDDRMYGEAGEDAMLGDRGGIVDRLVDGSPGDPTPFSLSIQSPPALSFTAWAGHQLDRRFDLTHDLNDDGTGFSSAAMVMPGQLVGGTDLMRGGPGHDSMHGAFNDDLMNGDAGGDILFGHDGSDVMWGGKGCDPDAGDACGPLGQAERGTNDRYVDYLFGGYGGAENNFSTGGADILDYRPRPGVDPASWFEATDTRYTPAFPAEDPVAAHQHHQGIDWIYGGWDRDVMQADVADNGPNSGDRLLDWSGAYNLYTHCNSAYGGFNDVRLFSPDHQAFLQKLAYALGAGPTQNDVLAAGSSGFRELALVYSKDVKQNTGKAYPTTPGHFNDFSCAP